MKHKNEVAHVGNAYAWRMWDGEKYALGATLSTYGSQKTVSLFEAGDRITGLGATVREAYRAAWREMRLARHTIPDLLRRVDELRRQVDRAELDGATQHVLVLMMHQRLHQRNTRRRARHAAATRAHREVRQAWRAMSAEVEALQRQLDEANEEMLRWRNLYNSASQSARRLAQIQALAAQHSVTLQLPPAHDIESVVRVLLERAQQAAEWHRRATAAEARAEQLHAGQQRLVAAAAAAGLQYTVEQGQVMFIGKRDGQLEAHGA